MATRKKKDHTMLYVLGTVAAVAVAGGGYYWYQKMQKSKEAAADAAATKAIAEAPPTELPAIEEKNEGFVPVGRIHRVTA